ncbi:BhlA/UviB family holin-like peptide [Halobacillus ihumii]|uniref:BhlA/UviB family holin-like peptide n=1 Tax=Halobacillus ihumii TaxID=2686092 RepID=UPI0013D1881E|nr:BhlA/UviB family holin-like peptide [Halobacillus ihumii]
MFNEVLIAEAAKQGVWALLYVALFAYTLKENRRQQEIAKEREDRLRSEYHEVRRESLERENKLTEFITTISQQFERLATGVEKLTEDVDEIKDELHLRNEVKKQRQEWRNNNEQGGNE